MGFMNVTRKRKQRTVVVHGRRKVKAIATASTYMGNFCGYNVKTTSNYSDREERRHISTLFIDEAINKAVEKYKKGGQGL